MDDKLALYGGTPTRPSFLPFFRPHFEKPEEDEVLDTLRSGWITTGPKTKRFEKEFAAYCQATHAIAVNSCTAALHVALVSLGVGPGDEVITTPITFASTANVIVHTGATPVFADVQPDTLNMDPAQIERAVTPRTKAIIPVHFIGQPCDMDAILSIARQHNLAVVEDAAHAIETVYKGRKVGSIGHATAFSFYATKNLTTGEGGMLTTQDEALADKARILSLHGISRDAWKRYSEEGYRHWEILHPGYKYNMFDLQAALGIHQLAKIERQWQRRKQLVEQYHEAFRDVPELQPLRQQPAHGCKNAYHLYVVLVKNEMLRASRDVLMNAIQAENIGIGIHFQAVHLQPYYRERYGFRPGMFPNAEYASDRVLSLPFFPTMTDEDARDAVRAVKKVIAHFAKRGSGP